MEAESIVILAPISQLGCFNACSFVTFSKFLFTHSSERSTGCSQVDLFNRIVKFSQQALKYCGMFRIDRINIYTFLFCQVWLQSLLQPLSVSLFASAMFLPASIAFKVGRNPEKPTIAVKNDIDRFHLRHSSIASLRHRQKLLYQVSAKFSCSTSYTLIHLQ